MEWYTCNHPGQLVKHWRLLAVNEPDAAVPGLLTYNVYPLKEQFSY